MGLLRRTVIALMEPMGASVMFPAMKSEISPLRWAIQRSCDSLTSFFCFIFLSSLPACLFIPALSLQDFPTFDGSRRGNLIRVSNRLVYNHPSHIQVSLWQKHYDFGLFSKAQDALIDSMCHRNGLFGQEFARVEEVIDLTIRELHSTPA